MHARVGPELAPNRSTCPRETAPGKAAAQAGHSFSKVQLLLTCQSTGFRTDDCPRWARLTWWAAPTAPTWIHSRARFSKLTGTLHTHPPRARRLPPHCAVSGERIADAELGGHLTFEPFAPSTSSRDSVVSNNLRVSTRTFSSSSRENS